MAETVGLIKIGRFSFLITKSVDGKETCSMIVSIVTSGSSSYHDTISLENLIDAPFKALDYAAENKEVGAMHVRIGNRWL